MFKKILYTMLTVAALLSFAACDSDGSGKEPTEAPAAAKTPNTSGSEEKKELSELFDALEKYINDTDNTFSPIPTPSATIAPEHPATGTPVTDGVIVDNEACSLKITSIDENGYWGYTLTVQMENKTNANLFFSMDDVYVNEVFCDPYWYCDVPAGETVSDEITFYTAEFESLGITEVTSLHFFLNVYDIDNWLDSFVRDSFTFYPNGKENAIAYTYTFAPDDILLVDSDTITIGITQLEAVEPLGYVMYVYMENHSEQTLMFTLDDVSINGFMCDPFWSFSLPSGKKAHDFIIFYQSDLDLFGITEVTELEFLLSAYLDEDWLSDAIVQESFTIHPVGEEAVTSSSYTVQDGDIVLFNTKDCTMILTGFAVDEERGYFATAYLENNSDTSLTFTLDDAAINGVDCEPYWAATVLPGKKSVCYITWSNYVLEQSNITTVETLTLPVRVYDQNFVDKPDYVNETFTVTP